MRTIFWRTFSYNCFLNKDLVENVVIFVIVVVLWLSYFGDLLLSFDVSRFPENASGGSKSANNLQNLSFY